MTKRCLVAFICHRLASLHVHVPIALVFLLGIATGPSVCTAGGVVSALVQEERARPRLPLGNFCLDDAREKRVWMLNGFIIHLL